MAKPTLVLFCAMGLALSSTVACRGGSNSITDPIQRDTVPQMPTPNTPGWKITRSTLFKVPIAYAYQVDVGCGIVAYTTPGDSLIVEMFGEPLVILRAPASDRPNQDQFFVGMKSVSISPNCKTIAFAPRSQMVVMYSVESGRMGAFYIDRECHMGVMPLSLSDQYLYAADGCRLTYRWTVSGDTLLVTPTSPIVNKPDASSNVRTIAQDRFGRTTFMVLANGCRQMLNNATALSTGLVCGGPRNDGLEPAAASYSTEGDFLAYTAGNILSFNSVNLTSATFQEHRQVTMPVDGYAVGVCSQDVMFGGRNGGVYVYKRGDWTPYFQLQVSSDNNSIVKVGCSGGQFWAVTHKGMAWLGPK